MVLVIRDPSMNDSGSITDFWHELIVSSTTLSAAVFSLVGGPLNELLGRKKVIILTGFPFIGGAMLLAFAPAKEFLLAGRLILGAAIGMSSTSIPAYVAEAAPPNIRGRLVTLYQLFITMGFLIAGVLAGAFNYLKPDVSWR